MHRGRRTQEAPCINVIRSCSYEYMCVYTGARTRIRDILYRGAAHHVSRRSLGKTTSRLSNYRSCIMHRSPQVPSLALSFSISVSLPRPSPAPTLLEHSPRRSPENKVPEFRGRTKLRKCWHQLRRRSTIRFPPPLSERTTGVSKGGIGKCSDRARRSSIYGYPVVGHVYVRVHAHFNVPFIRRNSRSASNWVTVLSNSLLRVYL